MLSQISKITNRLSSVRVMFCCQMSRYKPVNEMPFGVFWVSKLQMVQEQDNSQRSRRLPYSHVTVTGRDCLLLPSTSTCPTCPTCQGPMLLSGGPGHRPLAPGHTPPLLPNHPADLDTPLDFTGPGLFFRVVSGIDQAFHIVPPTTGKLVR